MFKAMPQGTRVQIDARQIASMKRSINLQRIAMGGGPMRAAKATIVSIYSPAGGYRMFIYLGVAERTPGSDAPGILFRSDPDIVPLKDYERFEAQAIEMVESQGFEMEKVEYAGLAPQEQREILSELPFNSPASSAPPPLPRPRETSTAPFMGGIALPAHEASGLPALGSQAMREPTVPPAQVIHHLGRLLTLF